MSLSPSCQLECRLNSSSLVSMVSAGIADQIMLIRWNAGATFNGEGQRYQCVSKRECPEGNGVRKAVTYVTADDIAQGLDPEMMVLLDIRVDQIKVEVEDMKSGEIKIHINKMACLQCEDRFNSLVCAGVAYTFCVDAHWGNERREDLFLRLFGVDRWPKNSVNPSGTCKDNTTNLQLSAFSQV